MVTERASWVTDEIDMKGPNVARMYDFFLGGAHNFRPDRDAALAVLEVAPQVADAARANRAFLHRAVRYALDQGIRQFLDLGSGIPTAGNVHEIVHRVDPHGRVLYVDTDPVVIAHAHALLQGTDAAGAIEADLRDTATILGRDETRRLIDFEHPVAVLLVSVLHFVNGDIDRLIQVVSELVRPAAPGSQLVISHASASAASAQTDAVQELYGRTPTPLHLRSPQEIRALFADLDLIPPDPDATQPAELVPITQWRRVPGDDELPPDVAAGPFIARFLAGVGRKSPAVTTRRYTATFPQRCPLPRPPARPPGRASSPTLGTDHDDHDAARPSRRRGSDSRQG
jgi:hypothetical protein